MIDVILLILMLTTAVYGGLFSLELRWITNNRMCWLYRVRWFKHLILLAITMSEIHWWEMQHYYHSKIHVGLLYKRTRKK